MTGALLDHIATPTISFVFYLLPTAKLPEPQWVRSVLYSKKDNSWEIVGAEIVQAGCHSCHQTKTVGAPKAARRNALPHQRSHVDMYVLYVSMC